EAERARLMAELEAAKQQSETMRSEFEHELAAAAEQVGELESRDDRTSLLEQAVAAREAELDRRREAERLRSEAFDRLQEQLRQREVDLEAARARVRERETAHTELRAELDGARIEETEARAQIARLQASCTELERTVVELGERSSADNESREEALRELEAALATRETELAGRQGTAGAPA